MQSARLAVDIGGTFTDLALEHAGMRSTTKVLTTPSAPEQGVMAGIRTILRNAGLAPADIDRALKLGGGFRMGPLELGDLIGHDINYGVAESIFAAYGGKTRFRPQPAQKALVEAGHLGRKSGRGFYLYDADGSKLDAPALTSAGGSE